MAIRTIVAAIALENGDEPVVRRAIELAAEHDARLIMVHAIESLPEPDSGLPPPTNRDTLKGALTAEAVETLERMIASAAVRAEIEVDFGKAAPVIDRLARDRDADLLVIGPGKPRNLRERLFGSTADGLVRCGSCPVLVVRRRPDEPYRRVVAAIDFSPTSSAAAGTAMEIAPRAAMELVHALEIPLTFEQAMLKAGTLKADIERYRRAKVRAARKELRTVCAVLSLPKDSTVRVVYGDPATVLVRLARAGKTDLMALGVQGRNAIAEMVMGSVSRHMLAAASCDILLGKTSIS